MPRLRFLALPLAAALLAAGVASSTYADPTNSPNSQEVAITCGSNTYVITNITSAHDAASQIVSINGQPANGVGILLRGNGQRTGQQGSILTCSYQGESFQARLVP